MISRSLVAALVIWTLTVSSGLCQVTPASVYSVKFLCGFSNTPFNPSSLPAEPPVKPGNYATAVNIHNYHSDFNVSVCKKAVLAPAERCLTSATAAGCLPPLIGNFVPVTLHPNQAFEVDCGDIVTLLRPALPGQTLLPAFIKGFVEIVVVPDPNLPKTNPLSVTAVYTAQGCSAVPGQGCKALGGIEEEVVPQNSFSGELPLNCPGG